MELMIAMVYGKALFDAAHELDKVDEMREEIIQIDMVFEREPDFVGLLNNPAIADAKKKTMIRNVFEGRISKEALSLLYILIDKGRFYYYHRIVKEYKHLVDVYKGQGKGKIYSAVPLTDDQIQKFANQASQLLQEKVRLKNVVDESLIGGVKLLVDGKLIDASLRGRLDTLSEEIEKL